MVLSRRSGRQPRCVDVECVDEGDGRPMTAVRSKLGAGVALASVVALAAVIVWQAEAVRDDHRQDKAQQQAIRLAEDQVVDLTTLDSATVKDKIDSMSRRTSGT